MTSIREALQKDHRRHDVLFAELLSRVRVDDAAAAEETWIAFERALVAHLEAEEKEMIPIFQHHEPAEAAALLADHARIRSLLAELGVMLDLHALREYAVEELVALLRAHAAREDAALYRRADDTELAEARDAPASRQLPDARRRPSSVDARRAGAGL